MALAFALGVAACDQTTPPDQHIPGADAERGRRVIAAIGCGACHEVPGVRGARGVVGPSLTHFGRRSLIGGSLPNQPGVLVAWVRDAPRLAPDTAMPSLPLTAGEARDVAAYLYTLR